MSLYLMNIDWLPSHLTLGPFILWVCDKLPESIRSTDTHHHFVESLERLSWTYTDAYPVAKHLPLLLLLLPVFLCMFRAKTNGKTFKLESFALSAFGHRMDFCLFNFVFYYPWHGDASGSHFWWWNSWWDCMTERNDEVMASGRTKQGKRGIPSFSLLLDSAAEFVRLRRKNLLSQHQSNILSQ